MLNKEQAIEKLCSYTLESESSHFLELIYEIHGITTAKEVEDQLEEILAENHIMIAALIVNYNGDKQKIKEHIKSLF